jgi:hypothetical protein
MASVRSMVAVLESYGPRFIGNDVAEMAQDWIDYGFSPAEADSWCEIGVWNPATAAAFRDAGLSPDEVRFAAERLIEAERTEWTDENWGYSRYTDGDPIYAACNYDISPDVIVEAASKCA